MRLLALTALTMTAFAANSVLNRMALEDTGTGPASFALVRLLSGAVMLVGLVLWRRGGVAALRGPVRAVGPLTLALYILGFSFAYVTLDAGVGALILFGGVQVTMFAGAVVSGESIPALRWVGAGLAFAGLVYLMWPSGRAAPETGGALLMIAAAVGWGLYSLHGRTAGDPLASTAVNFGLATPLAVVVWVVVRDGMSTSGLLLALVSGMVTSGLGYALWYSVLPHLPASSAAVAQLTVPVIALAGGVLLLGETATPRLLAAGALVLGGVGLSVGARRRPPAART
jgi:drug/metabolite transporter (DMT)-like permease